MSKPERPACHTPITRESLKRLVGEQSGGLTAHEIASRFVVGPTERHLKRVELLTGRTRE